jgi:centrosomal protein CEP41
MAYNRVVKKETKYMDKIVPKSSKYSGVEGKIDTGLTVNKVKTVSASQFAQRRDEIYFRITRHQIFELYNEYEADEYEDIAEAETRHIGARGPVVVTHSETARDDYEKPYLLLDVREQPDFNTYHMLQARSFPFVLMRRDRSPPELNKFKNKPEHLVIVIADDERLGKDAAKLLVDRGCDNVYLLSGRINDFAIDYPSFIEGRIPEGLVSTTPGIKKYTLYIYNFTTLLMIIHYIYLYVLYCVFLQQKRPLVILLLDAGEQAAGALHPRAADEDFGMTCQIAVVRCLHDQVKLVFLFFFVVKVNFNFPTFHIFNISC